MSSRPRPTTVKPMTEPEEKATRSPRFRLGLGGPGVGLGGNLHADEAGQHGPDTAGDEGEGGKFGEHLSVRGEGNDQQEHKDHQKYLGYGAVLPLEVGVGALTDRGRDLLHQVGALRKFEDVLPLDPGKDQSNDRSDQPHPKEIFKVQNLHSFACSPPLPGGELLVKYSIITNSFCKAARSRFRPI